MSTKTLKVPQQLFRSGFSEYDAEKKTMRLSISSEEPYKRRDWMTGEDYYEVLDHSREGCDMSRLRGGAPLLYNHDRNVLLGTISNPTIDGGRCYVEAKISEADDVKDYRTKISEGILKDTSIGYSITDEGECVGARDGIPVYKFRFAVHEASLVTIPADTTVGVGRSAEDEKESFREIRIAEKIPVDSISKTNKKETATKTMSDTASTETQKIDVSNVRNEAVTAERERVNGINKLSRHFAENGLAGRKIDTSELARQYVESGKSEREFQDAVVRGNFPEMKPVAITEPDLGMSKKEKRQFSLLRAIGLLGRKQPLDGLEKEASDAWAKQIGKEVDGLGFYIPQDVLRESAFPNGYNRDRAEQARALFAGTYAAAGAFVGTELMGGSLIELLRNQMYVVAMGARTMSGLRSNVAIPRQTGGATASWLAEDSTITATNQTVGQLNLTPHKLAAATAYTGQLLAQSSVDVENFVRQDLMTIIAIERDRAAINGSGVSGEPTGILNTSSLSTSVTLSGAQSMTYANAVSFETNLATNNAAQGKLGYLTTPTVRGNAKLVAEIAAANSIPVWKNDMVNGYPARATNQVPTATSVIFGNWDDLILADWADTQVIVDPYSLSLQGQVRIVMQMLCDNGIRHSKSFSVSTN